MFTHTVVDLTRCVTKSVLITLYIFPSLTADCQSVKRQLQHASHCQWQSVAATFVLFFASGTNIVANWVKKWHKVKEDSSNIFKIANIGKHWQKEAQLRNRIKWNKFYIVLKWQRLAKCGTSKLRQKVA